MSNTERAAEKSGDFSDFGDIEEALAELFEAKGALESLGPAVSPVLASIREKVERACHLLDRPWP